MTAQQSVQSLLPPPPGLFWIPQYHGTQQKRLLEEESWDRQQLQKWCQVLGVILAFLFIMVILRFVVNCLIDVAVLRNTESLTRQLSQLRRWFCPWWHPRTQPQEDFQGQQERQSIGEDVEGRGAQRSSRRDAALDRVFAGLLPSEKEELLMSLLRSQIVLEEDLMQWKQDVDCSTDVKNDLELCRPNPVEDNSSVENDISSSTSRRSNPTSLLCPICIHDLEVGNFVISLTTSCQHRFHSHCLVQWLSKHNRECPYCRTEILTQDMLVRIQACRNRQQQRLPQDRTDSMDDLCGRREAES